ncbi:hypothetical protein AGENTSMITH_118 [Bacillus phage vB_BspM_AgentSmith]|nr:hypothetical protein AGENTSMITH_118 [Bacillus phage vB_BspM_AgentSmith]
MSTTLLSKIQPELRSGDLLAWKTTKINSFFDFILFLYQKIFKAEFTHVAIVAIIGDRQFIVEATPPVVRLFPISMTDDFYLIKTDLELNSRHYDLLLKNLGKPYGLWDFVKGIFGIGSSDDSYYCSELAGNFYNNIGYIVDDEAPHTPHALVRAVLKKSKHEMIFVRNDRGNLNGI